MERRKGPAKYSRAETRIQKSKALELFLAGATDRRIAEALDVSLWTAQKRVKDSLEEMKPVADVDRYRTRQIAENEVRRRKLMKGIIETSTGSTKNWQQHANLQRAMTQLHEREAKALNLDQAPAEWQRFHNMSDAELDAWLEEDMKAAQAENPDAAEAVRNA